MAFISIALCALLLVSSNAHSVIRDFIEANSVHFASDEWLGRDRNAYSHEDMLLSDKDRHKNIRIENGARRFARRTLQKTHTISYEDGVPLERIIEHISAIESQYGDIVSIGDVSHHPVWTGFSLHIDMKKLRETRSTTSEFLMRSRYFSRLSHQLEMKSIVDYIQALSGVKSVHKSRKISIAQRSNIDEVMGNIDDYIVSHNNNENQEKREMSSSDSSSSAEAKARESQTTFMDDAEEVPNQAPTSGIIIPTPDPSPVPLPWGLDRIDQTSLPLDGEYKPTYDGMNVNVFVVDTGLDTLHTEFSDGAITEQQPLNDPYRTRYIANLFDVYAAEDKYAKTEDLADLHDDSLMFTPSDNNDHVGHGTHCAGTIGGRHVGVSPSASIFGVRVLNAQGSGDDESILLGLAFVYTWYIENEGPYTVINMSLGGTCESYEECSTDALVTAVDKLSAIGIVVVVAAGNSGCDACLETPAFADSALTIGASNIKDEATFFSDYGKCVDLYAPGMNITSSCASTMCRGKHDQFTRMSGTSMASPHTAGMVAQFIQMEVMLKLAEVRQVSRTVDAVSVAITCEAAKDVLDFHRGEGHSHERVTRNLLLHTPSNNLTEATCDPGLGCSAFNDCSGHGYCQKGECLCDNKYWGKNCSSLERGYHCDDGLQFIPYSLYDLTGSGAGWAHSEFRVHGPHVFPNGIHSAVQKEMGVSHYYGEIPVEASSMCGGLVTRAGVCLALKDDSRELVTPAATESSESTGNSDTDSGSDSNDSSSSDANNATASTRTLSSNDLELSYALDVIPGSIATGQGAAWSLCGRRGGAPARWEVVIHSDNSTNENVYTNKNSQFDVSGPDDDNDSDDEAGNEREQMIQPLLDNDKVSYASNATYCELRCLDHSAIVELDMFLINPFASYFDDNSASSSSRATESMVKTILVGSEDFTGFGYSIIDLRTGLEISGGNFMIDETVVTLLSLMLSAMMTQKEVDPRVLEAFPVKQVHSFCMTSALTSAARQVAIQNGSGEKTIDVGLVFLNDEGEQSPILTYSFCGANSKVNNDFTFYRFVFSEDLQSFTCALLKDDGTLSTPGFDSMNSTGITREADPSPSSFVTPSQTQPKSFLERLAASSSSHLRSNRRRTSASSASSDTQNDADASNSFAKTTKIAIFNTLATNFTVPNVAGTSYLVDKSLGSSSDSNNYGYPFTGWGWFDRQYDLISISPTSGDQEHSRMSRESLSSSSPLAEDTSFAKQQIVPLLVNTTLANSIVQLPVTEWRLMTSSKDGNNGGILPDYAKSFWSTCGITSDYRNSYKFKVSGLVRGYDAGAGISSDNDASSTPEEDYSRLSSGGLPSSAGYAPSEMKCERECLTLDVQKVHGVSDGASIGFPHGDNDIPLMVLLNNGQSSAEMEDDHLKDSRKLNALVKLMPNNNLCLGNATDNQAQSTRSCHRLILGAGNTYSKPLWKVCKFDLSDGSVHSEGPNISHLKDSLGNQLLPSTAMMDFCVTDWTECEVSYVSTPSCPQSQNGDMDKREHAMYAILVSESKDGWNGAKYTILKAPAPTLSNIFAGVVPPPTHRHSSNGSSTVGDDDTLGADDNPFINEYDVDNGGYELVVQGTMNGSTKAEVDTATLCLTNGCYLWDTNKGQKPQTALYILCGTIGQAGMGAIFGIAEGQCTVYSNLILCQFTQIFTHLGSFIFPFTATALLILFAISSLILIYCRRKGYPAMSTVQEYQLLDTRLDALQSANSVNNPIHSSQLPVVSYHATDGGNGVQSYSNGPGGFAQGAPPPPPFTIMSPSSGNQLSPIHHHDGDTPASIQMMQFASTQNEIEGNMVGTDLGMDFENTPQQYIPTGRRVDQPTNPMDRLRQELQYNNTEEKQEYNDHL